MIYKEHLIELWVNGNKVELENQKSLNMRFNDVLLDPTKISTSQAEYSFEFEVPATPHNNVIFDYANNLSRENKFHQRYNAEVYCDGTVIFSGSITINSYKDKKYNLNLVSVKVFSLDDIFGDSVMTDIRPMQRLENGTIKRDENDNPLHEKWAIDFNGISTINQINTTANSAATEVTFPLVSYGAFQKSPYNEDEIGADYTSKFDLDEWNMWYVESFYPSHNMLETLKNCFETKDYVVGGDAFHDQYLKNIYMSVNLADGQDPEYNVGNPRFGKVDLSTTITTNGSGYEQELQFPYYKVYAVGATSEGITSQTEYNYTSINMYDMLGNTGVTVNNTPNYMYQPNEGVIVVPATGFYKIEMTVNSTLNTTGTIHAKQWIQDMVAREMSEQDVDLTVGFDEITPIEVALIKNYDDNYELIKGKHNKRYVNGNPNDEYYYISGYRRDNIVSWQTCFPHEDPYASELPTEAGDLNTKNNQSRMGGRRGESTSSNSFGASYGTSASGNFSGRRGGTRGGTIDPTGGGRQYSPLKYGYIYNDREIMCYDQVVSDTFVCGLSSMSGGVPAVMKNGYSWSPITAEKNSAFAPVIGYSMLSREAGTGNLVYEQTDFNQNTYINTPISYCNVSRNSMNGYVSCMVWLNKNDVLRLVTVHRNHETEIGNPVNYSTTTSVRLKIEAFSNRSYDMLKATHDNRYEAPTEFDTKLNLAGFFNREKKMSDWVKNISDAFNLEIIQNGKTVTINTKRKSNTGILTAVDIDDRVNSAEVEASKITYPRSMAVKYKIDTDEWGFERSAVESQGGNESILNSDDWIKYGDSGFTTIYLNDDTWETSTSDKNLQFSYCWYDKFNHYQCDSAFTKISDSAVTISMPVISKYSYMIDGYSYEESMKHDGYGLSQRFWFRPTQGGGSLWTRTYPPESYVLCVPRKSMYLNDKYLYMSYKNTEQSLLTEFFSMSSFLASNYVEVEVYLTPEEYNRIKNGAYVHFDSDLYIPTEISGYDPTGYNTTTLRMMKKVI